VPWAQGMPPSRQVALDSARRSPALKGDQRSEPDFMPNWTSHQMAGVGPEATRVFGRNAQILLKNSQIEQLRKSRSRAYSVV
jgi:hypothetical protein